MTDPVRFPIRFTGGNTTMAMLGITRSNSFVDVSPAALTVHMGWAFRANVARAAIRSAEPDRDPVRGWGAHGWRGVWLVNGSSSGIVRIDFEPAGRGRLLGWPIKLRVLRVAVDDPDGLMAALTTG